MKTKKKTTNGTGRTNAFKRRFLPVFIGIALPAVALTAIPVTSDAGHDRYNHCSTPPRKIVGYCERCRTPIYAHYQVVGRDRCGAPRYAWVKQSHRCSQHSRHRGHDRSHYRDHSPHQSSGHHYRSHSSLYDFLRRFR